MATPSTSQRMKSSCRVRLRCRKGASCKSCPVVRTPLLHRRARGGGVFDREDHKGRIGMKVAAQWIQIVSGALLFTATLFAIVALPGLVSESASSAPVTSDL